MDEGASKEELHLLISGKVQGVGFRVTVCEIARQLGIVGSVRNCSDGKVEVVCQGEDKSLELFLEKLALKNLPAHVTHIEKLRRPALESFSAFSIVR